MISKGIKFYVYFIIVSFIVLWMQLAQIVMTTSSEYVFENSSEVILTATKVVEMTENQQINMVGIIGWGIVAAGFLGVVATIIVLVPFRKIARSKPRTVYSGSKRSYGKIPYTTATHSEYKKPAFAGNGANKVKNDKKVAMPQNTYYYKYGRNIEMRR